MIKNVEAVRTFIWQVLDENMAGIGVSNPSFESFESKEGTLSSDCGKARKKEDETAALPLKLKYTLSLR